MYHVELRQFPHNTSRFNLTVGEVRSGVLEPWVREGWVEFGERKWNRHQAKLTVLEGPEIPVGQLSMGRGWRIAQRQGEEVTEQLLVLVVEGLERAPAPRTAPAALESGETPSALLADSLGLEVLAKLAAGSMSLPDVWRLAATRDPAMSASTSLAIAEAALSSLLRAGLVALARGEQPTSLPVMEPEEVDSAIRTITSWIGSQASDWVLVSRA